MVGFFPLRLSVALHLCFPLNQNTKFPAVDFSKCNFYFTVPVLQIIFFGSRGHICKALFSQSSVEM